MFKNKFHLNLDFKTTITYFSNCKVYLKLGSVFRQTLFCFKNKSFSVVYGSAPTVSHSSQVPS